MKRMHLIALVALVSLAAAVFLAVGQPAKASHSLVLTFTHAPVSDANTQYLDVPPAGASVADTRTYYLPLMNPGSSTVVGFLTGVTTTVAVDKPAAGVELRSADLVFVVGGLGNQIVVGGISPYAPGSISLTRSESVVRPILGGSGKYAGARGWCVSTRAANDTWTQTLHLMLP